MPNIQKLNVVIPEHVFEDAIEDYLRKDFGCPMVWFEYDAVKDIRISVLSTESGYLLDDTYEDEWD